MLRNTSIRGSALLGLVVCLTTASVTSAGAAPGDARLTLAVSPPVLAFSKPVTVAVKAIDEQTFTSTVTLQFKECGLYPVQFREVVELLARPPSREGSASVTAMANGIFRATSLTDVSNEVEVATRPLVGLVSTRSGHFRAYVDGRLSFWHKRVRIERYDRGRSRWVLLRTIVLNRTLSMTTGNPSYTFISSRSDEFSLKVPVGTKLRAVLPLSQAKPCYVAGTSQVVQT